MSALFLYPKPLPFHEWFQEFAAVIPDMLNLLPPNFTLLMSVLVLSSCADLLLAGTPSQVGSEKEDGAIPQTLDVGAFDAILGSSPFTRSLGVSDSIILTGIANIEGQVFATLLDTETLDSQVVSKSANHQGWQLLGVTGNPTDSKTWGAKVQVTGGQVIAVRYQKPPARRSRPISGGSSTSHGGSSSDLPPLSSSQVAEAKNAAVNYREGFSSDGYPRLPPPEMLAKLSRLSTSQREDINRQMLGWRNKGLGLDERRKIYEGLVERSLQERR